MVSCLVIGAWAFQYKPVWLSNLRLKMNQTWQGRTIVIFRSHVSVWSIVYLRTLTHTFDPSESFWYDLSDSDWSHWYIANTCWSYQPLISYCVAQKFLTTTTASLRYRNDGTSTQGNWYWYCGQGFGKRTDRFASALKNLPCMLLSTHLWKLHNRSWWVEG